jgi:multiple sugar transport system substrate-binding protein
MSSMFLSRRRALGLGGSLLALGILGACAPAQPPTPTPGQAAGAQSAGAKPPAEAPKPAEATKPAEAAKPAAADASATKPSLAATPPGALTAAPAKEEPKAAQPAAKPGSTTLQYWSFLDTKIRMQGREQLFPEFEGKSGAKIEVTFVDTSAQDAKATAAFAAKTLPDMIDSAFMHLPIGWLQVGIVRDMTEDLNALGREDFPQNVLRMWTEGGKLGGIPFMGYSHVLWKRKDVLSEKGVDVKTWDDMVTAAKAVHGTKSPAGKDRYGFGAYFNQRHADHMWQNTVGPHGVYVFDEQGKLAINNPKTAAALDRLRSLKPYFAPGAPNAIQGDLFTLFQDGLLPFIYGSPTPINAILKNAPEQVERLDWQLIPAASTGDARRGAYLGCYSFMLTSTTRALDQAREFVRWYFSPAVYVRIFPGTDLGHQPVRRSVAEGEELKKLIPPVAHKVAQLGLQALAIGTVPGQDYGPSPYARHVDAANFWSNMLNRTADTDTAGALKWAEAELKKIMDDNPVKR